MLSSSSALLRNSLHGRLSAHFMPAIIVAWNAVEVLKSKRGMSGVAQRCCRDRLATDCRCHTMEVKHCGDHFATVVMRTPSHSKGPPACIATLDAKASPPGLSLSL